MRSMAYTALIIASLTANITMAEIERKEMSDIEKAEAALFLGTPLVAAGSDIATSKSHSVLNSNLKAADSYVKGEHIVVDTEFTISPEKKSLLVSNLNRKAYALEQQAEILQQRADGLVKSIKDSAASKAIYLELAKKIKQAQIEAGIIRVQALHVLESTVIDNKVTVRMQFEAQSANDQVIETAKALSHEKHGGEIKAVNKVSSAVAHKANGLKTVGRNLKFASIGGAVALAGAIGVEKAIEIQENKIQEARAEYLKNEGGQQ